MRIPLADWIRTHADRHGDLVSAARAHQVTGYSGPRIPAEEYIRACGQLSDEDRLVLVMGEVAGRAEAGESVQPDEYRRRFPDLADDLALQFELLALTLPETGPPAIPGYRVGPEIGRGGSATVYRATHEASGRDVALKVLSSEFDDQPVVRVRFLHEGELLTGFDHPNIARVHECGVADDRLYLAMELATDGTLADRLAEGPLSPAEARDLVSAVADAAEYAHRRRVVHRDIKPSNVLFSGAVPKLTDFGLAKQMDFDGGLTSSRQFVGTPAYAAPEQAERAGRTSAYQSPELLANAAQIRATADVYSLGVVLFECLTGHLPYSGTTAAAVCEAKLSAVAPDPRTHAPDLPAAVAEVCRRSLARLAVDRYPTAEAFAEALRATGRRRRFRWFGGA